MGYTGWTTPLDSRGYRGTVHRLEAPVDPLEVVVMFQAHAPDSLEEAGPHPGLKPQVAGAAGTVLLRNHLPLTAGSQNVENAVEHGAVRHARSTVGPGRLVGRQRG